MYRFIDNSGARRVVTVRPRRIVKRCRRCNAEIASYAGKVYCGPCKDIVHDERMHARRRRSKVTA
jgi:Zn finger protein HypA/HybF involved in hydrogenase expression